MAPASNEELSVPDLYLQPNFDANKLTKPQLRSILSQHGVNELPPLSAKKEILVNLFDTRIKAKAEDIKAAQSKIKPSSHGIVILDKDSRPSPSRSSPTKNSKAGSSPQPVLRGRRSTSSSGSKKTSRSVSRKRSPSKKPFENDDSPLTLVQKALPRYADSPVSARVKLSERISTIDQKLARTIEPKKQGTNIALRILRDALSMFVFFLIVTAGSFYIRWKYIYPFPYCNNGVHHWSWLPKNWQALDSWMELLQINCISCPHHASCFDGRMNCNDGYVKSSNMLAFGSSCVPDKKKLWVLDRIAQAIYKELQARGGKAVCSGNDEDRYLKIDAIYKQKLFAHFATDLQSTSSNSEAIIKHAIDDLMKSSAYGVSSATDAMGEKVYWLQHPRVPLQCHLRNVVNTLWLRYRRTFLYFIVISILSTSLICFIKWKLFYWARTEEMSMIIYQMLAENAALHKRDCTVPAAIPVDQIRDALLMTNKYKSMYSSQIFNLLWPEVVRKVASNANVTETELHMRGGSMNQWEWIGMDLFQKKQIVEVDDDDFEETGSSTIASPLARQRNIYPRL